MFPKYSKSCEQSKTLKTFSVNKVMKNNIYITLFNILALYYPEGAHFGKAFLLSVLNGKKKLLPLGCVGGFNIPYYSKNKQLTKDDIFKKFVGDENLMAFIPDDPDVKSISREFLLSVLFYASRDKYLSLYEKYKDLEMQRSTTGNRKFIAKISEEMLTNLRNYNPVNI